MGGPQVNSTHICYIFWARLRGKDLQVLYVMRSPSAPLYSETGSLKTVSDCGEYGITLLCLFISRACNLTYLLVKNGTLINR